MGFFGEAADTVGLGNTHKLATTPAKLDPRYTNLVGNVTKSALDYRKNMPNILGQKTNQALDNSRLSLAQRYTDADRAANARGMFYGGKRAGMRSQAENVEARDLASQIRGFNVDVENTAQGLEDTGIEAAYGMRSDQQALYDNAYNEALSRRQGEIDKRSGILNKMGQVGPQLIGGFLGSKGSKKEEKSTSGGTMDAGTDYSLASRTA